MPSHKHYQKPLGSLHPEAVESFQHPNKKEAIKQTEMIKKRSVAGFGVS